VPILHTNVALRNWRPWIKMGLRGAVSPGSYHVFAGLDFPVSLGGYAYSGGPDEPVVIRMFRYPHMRARKIKQHSFCNFGYPLIAFSSLKTT